MITSTDIAYLIYSKERELSRVEKMYAETKTSYQQKTPPLTSNLQRSLGLSLTAEWR